MTTTLILTLATILTVTSNQEFDEAYYKPLETGYSYGYIGTSPTEHFPTVSSLQECAFYALNSQSEFFTYNKVSRVCKNYSPKDIMEAVSTSDTNEISYYRRSPSTWNVDKCSGIYCPNFFRHPILDIWNHLPIEQVKLVLYKNETAKVTMVFDGLYVLYVGSPSSWNVDKCNGIHCPNFFRHPILDIWNHLPIEQVKLVIYKNETALVTMVFDGRNSHLGTWFDIKHLKSSPWDDLAPGQTNIFSIYGDV
ncbi:Hypothetical predicted protein [Octopus vulgaris]|uniref:Uncharacterized protein n=1 Tax=Octopus vulgaris TaxID=6645 RepID=A0AA36BXW3_OCTVU|nr:Hypothetical predicted protein [Octopus vulgaris]